MEVAIGPPSMAYGVKRAIVLGFGWEENRFGHFSARSIRAERFRPSSDGKSGIAVAVLTQQFRFGRDGAAEVWQPNVVRSQQIRGPWADIKAQKDREDAAAKAARLREYDRREALDARRDAVEARLTEFEGVTVTLFHESGTTGRVLIPIETLERLLDAADRSVVTGVRLSDG